MKTKTLLSMAAIGLALSMLAGCGKTAENEQEVSEEVT